MFYRVMVLFLVFGLVSLSARRIQIQDIDFFDKNVNDNIVSIVKGGCSYGNYTKLRFLYYGTIMEPLKKIAKRKIVVCKKKHYERVDPRAEKFFDLMATAEAEKGVRLSKEVKRRMRRYLKENIYSFYIDEIKKYVENGEYKGESNRSKHLLSVLDYDFKNYKRSEKRFLELPKNLFVSKELSFLYNRAASISYVNGRYGDAFYFSKKGVEHIVKSGLSGNMFYGIFVNLKDLNWKSGVYLLKKYEKEKVNAYKIPILAKKMEKILKEYFPKAKASGGEPKKESRRHPD